MGIFPVSSVDTAVLDSGACTPPLSKGPVAIVDLGSNSARVVVVHHPVPGVLETIAEARLDLRLATELDERSHLSERGIATTIDAVAEFAGFAREAGAGAINVVATAAIRTARNRDELLACVHAELGLAIEVLDGAEEAKFAAMGALHGLPIRSGAVVDVGGGSTEVARVIAGQIVGAWSFPLGALSASAAWLTDDPPTRKQLKAMRRMVAETLAHSAPSGLDAGEALIATGGSGRTLARLAQRQTNYPLPRLHGYSLERRTLRDVTAFLASHSAAERCEIDGVRAGRADSIVAGAVILDEMMRLGEAFGGKDAGARAAEAFLAEDHAGFDHAMLARIAAILSLSDGDKDGARPFLSLLPAAEKRLLRRCGTLRRCGALLA